MKIVIFSSTFLPNIGGLENIMAGLASNWVTKKNQVTLYTKTSEDLNSKVISNYKIIRNSKLLTLFNEVKNADIFVEANISLKTCLVGIFFFKKWVVIHHVPYSHQMSIQSFLKNSITWISKNISVSKYVSQTLFGKSIVIHNFYNPIYRELSLQRTKNSLLFVGRLVSDKGVMLLLNAILPILKIYPTVHLTIAGDGVEKISLVDFVQKNNLQGVVSFCGSQSPEILCSMYNQHEIVVIPSIWEEPFGIVALEALACGALVVYASGGGLSEAVDEDCILFQRGDVDSLQNALINALGKSRNEQINNGIKKKHLDFFSIDHIADTYLSCFKTILK